MSTNGLLRIVWKLIEKVKIDFLFLVRVPGGVHLVETGSLPQGGVSNASNARTSMRRSINHATD
jgi:hypothetical protein